MRRKRVMTHNEKIKVLVVDDHEAVRNGVARLLESAAPRLQVAGLARTGAEALELAGTTHPDVIVLDLLLDGENGLDLLPGLKRVCGAAIVILTSLNDTHTRAGALEHGARAWVSKLAPAGDLLAAIDAVAAG